MRFGDGTTAWADTMKYLGINFISTKRLKIDNAHFCINFTHRLMQ